MVTEQEVARTALQRRLRTPLWDYAAFAATFLGLYAGFVKTVMRRLAGPVLTLQPFDVELLILAAYRLARILAHEQIASFLRAPFVQQQRVRAPDSSERIEEIPRSDGIRQSVGQLLTCSWCTGVWTAAALLYGWVLAPRLIRPFVYVFAVAGGQLLLDVLTELINKANLYLQGKS